MISILVAFGVALATSVIFTPMFANFLVRNQYGQFIRQDGPTSHFIKRGTPTMGGVVFIVAAVFGYGLSLVINRTMPSASALMLFFLFCGLGFIGFLDDLIKISHQRSLGLNARAKLAGQVLVGIAFSVMALYFPDANGHTPATMAISFTRDLPSLDLSVWGVGVGTVLFVLWANFLISAWSNGVNLTDGLDGLATGASIFVFGAYTLIAFWQGSQACEAGMMPGCYEVRDSRDLAVASAALVGALVGFLWWNASPARIFMGDTGSLALGGAVAGLSILTQTELLAAIIGGLFVLTTISVVLQVGSFKLTGKRIFRMAPLHHHFEQKGWKEITVVIRFWLIAGIFAGLGVVVFYTEWVKAAFGE